MKALCGFFEGSYYNRIRVWFKCLSVMLMLAAILLTGCTGSEDVQSPDTDKVTASDTLEQSDAADSNKQIFMIYMIGSDLETDRGLASSDIDEIVSAGFDTDRVEVYLCTGGALSWHNEAISAYECAIYEVNSKGLNKLTALHGNDMTSPDTVTEFIDTVSGEYCDDIAAAYHLIFWDHGGGAILGFGRDENNNNSNISIGELAEAIGESDYIRSGHFFTQISFDACMMSMLEIGDALSPYAEYMVASETIENEKGWDYSFLGKTSVTNITEGEDICRCIADTYAEYYEADDKKHPEYSISVSHLPETGRVKADMERLFTVADLDMDRGGYSDIVRVRDASGTVGRATADASCDYDIVDLYSLSQGLASLHSDESDALCDSIDEYIVYNRSDIGNVHGTAVYFPYDNREDMTDWLDQYEKLGFSDDYVAFLRTFTGIMTGESLSTWQTLRDSTPIDYDKEDVLYVELSDDQIANYGGARLYVWEKTEDEEYPGWISCYMISRDVWLDRDKSRLLARKPENMYMLYNGKGEAVPLTTREIERYDEYVLYDCSLILTDEDMHSNNASMFFKVNAGDSDGEVVGIYDFDIIKNRDDNDVLPSRYEYLTIQDGASIQPYVMNRKITYSDNGEVGSVDEWESGLLRMWPLEMAGELMIKGMDTDEYAEGSLVYYFSIYDTQGNTYTTRACIK